MFGRNQPVVLPVNSGVMTVIHLCILQHHTNHLMIIVLYQHVLLTFEFQQNPISPLWTV